MKSRLSRRREGRLYGAGLECFMEEKAGSSRAFSEFRNVTLTPHIGGTTVDCFESMMEHAFSNAQKYLAGERLPAGDVVRVPGDPVPAEQDGTFVRVAVRR